jgi:hypothetical protein
VAEQRYEFRVSGRLSVRAREAFVGMELFEVPAETMISGDIADDGGVQDVLAMIQSMGLQVVSLRRASTPR